MRGEWERLGEPGAWLGLTAATVHAGILYAVADRGLYRVRGTDGAWSPVGDDIWDTRTLVSVGGGILALEQSGTLYRVDHDGSYVELSGDWSGTIALTGHGRQFFAVDHGALWRADPATGEASQITDPSWSTRFLVSAGNHLAALETSGVLYRVDASDGQATPIAVDTHWGGAEAMAGGTRLWVADGGDLWLVDPVSGDGARERLVTDGDFHPRVLLATDNTLYSFERSGSLYRVNIVAE